MVMHNRYVHQTQSRSLGFLSRVQLLRTTGDSLELEGSGDSGKLPIRSQGAARVYGPVPTYQGS